LLSPFDGIIIYEMENDRLELLERNIQVTGGTNFDIYRNSLIVLRIEG